jgi:dienelactone hydrolase
MLSSRWKTVPAILSLIAAAIAHTQKAPAPGVVIPGVTCLYDASQSYALYLPSHYSADRPWPIVYAFDPFARGKAPVELYKDVAEKYGYILVGSNNSKNGPTAPATAAAQAVWQDTHRRFSIDKNRVYAMGLSGGARFATSIALYCYTCAMTGVIAQGATYPVTKIEGGHDTFLYYAAAGDTDFNLPEILQLRRKRNDERTAQFKIKVYPGAHQWAPAEVFEDAVEWLGIKAMQAGTEKADPAFISRAFDRTKEEAAAAEQRGDTLTQFYALRSLVSDFKGFTGISVIEFESRLAAVRNSKAFRDALHREQRDIDLQSSLTSTASGEITGLAMTEGQEQIRLRQNVDATLTDLRRRVRAGSGAEHALYLRAFNQLFVQGMEDGEEALRQDHQAQAALYFELMAAAAPDTAWPLLRLAATRVKIGNRKAALKALEEAVKRGVKNPDTLTQDPDLQPLASEPEFQKLVEDLRARK